MSTLYCIVVGSDEGSSVRESAPLEHVSATGLIRDSVAQYTLVQTYVNPRTDASIEAVYTFPLYEGVAVSGFEAEVDGRKIVGRVEEKVAARKQYDEAVKAGKVASLLEQESPDVFQASIGNIPPGKSICIRITLVSDIKQDADENQVRFVLPTVIAPRYGTNPVSTSNINSSASKLSVNISCAMSKAINSIQSPSHPIEVHLGSSDDNSTSPVSFEPNRARVSLATDSFLDKDLVIIIRSLGLDAPRALVERHPADGTHAVSLTFAPRFALNPLRGSELIFVVDRSGSMQGSKIKQAGEALELFLRSIPFEDHCFNVIGFGSTYKALFPKSEAYTAESLKKGTVYAQQLRADMGGTEMTSAFQDAFQRRRRDVPTQIFLVTDGEIWDVDNLVQLIREAVQEGEKSSNSFVRVFSLGVGASVSHHLIESVARAGGGYAQLVVEGERMEKKVVNMLKAALMPPVTSVGVQWTSSTPEAAPAPAEDHVNDEDFEMVEASGESKPVPAPPSDNKPTINLFDTSPEVASPPPPPPTPLPDIVIPIQQAPFKVPALYRGARFTIYAILSSTTPVPKELVLRGVSPDGPVELKVNIESVQEGETMLHALAARTLVRDLEEGSSCIHALGRATTEADEQMLKRLGVHVLTQEGKKYKDLPLSSNRIFDITKQKILDLALKYNLSSKYTSWVAIDAQSQQSIIYNEVKDVVAEECFGGARYGSLGRVGGARRRMVKMGAPQAFVAQSCSLAAMPSSNPLMGSAVQQSSAFGALPKQAPGGGMILNERRKLQSSRKSGSGLRAGVGGFFKSKKQSAPLVGVDDLIGSAELEPEGKEAALPSDPHARLRYILQHQHFDGLFPLNSEIAALFSTSVKELQGKLAELRKLSGVQLSEPEWETVWATCLAVELMKKQLPDLQEEWELVVEKAEKRVAALVNSPQDVSALQQAASELLQATFKADSGVLQFNR